MLSDILILLGVAFVGAGVGAFVASWLLDRRSRRLYLHSDQIDKERKKHWYTGEFH